MRSISRILPYVIASAAGAAAIAIASSGSDRFEREFLRAAFAVEKHVSESPELYAGISGFTVYALSMLKLYAKSRGMSPEASYRKWLDSFTLSEREELTIKSYFEEILIFDLVKFGESYIEYVTDGGVDPAPGELVEITAKNIFPSLVDKVYSIVNGSWELVVKVLGAYGQNTSTLNAGNFANAGTSFLAVRAGLQKFKAK